MPENKTVISQYPIATMQGKGMSAVRKYRPITAKPINKKSKNDNAQ